MKQEDCYYLGTLKKTHGVKGGLMVAIENTIPLNIKETELMFIEIDGALVPFFIDKNGISLDSTGQMKSAIVGFDEIHSIEEASAYTDCKVYLPASHLEFREPDSNNEHLSLVGFAVIDESKGNIGILDEIVDIPQNPILRVIRNEKEILIPLTDEIIRSFDEQKREIYIKIPQGLLDIYL